MREGGGRERAREREDMRNTEREVEMGREKDRQQNTDRYGERGINRYMDKGDKQREREKVVGSPGNASGG